MRREGHFSCLWPPQHAAYARFVRQHVNAPAPLGSGVRAFLRRRPIISAAIGTFGAVAVVAGLHALGIPFLTPFTQHEIIEEVLVAAVSFPLFATFNLEHGEARTPAGKSDDRAA